MTREYSGCIYLDIWQSVSLSIIIWEKLFEGKTAFSISFTSFMNALYQTVFQLIKASVFPEMDENIVISDWEAVFKEMLTVGSTVLKRKDTGCTADSGMQSIPCAQRWFSAFAVQNASPADWDLRQIYISAKIRCNLNCTQDNGHLYFSPFNILPVPF